MEQILRYSEKRLNERETPRLSTEELMKMADFIFKSNCFEFNGEVKRLRSGTIIGTKFAPPYACIFMEAVKTEFNSGQNFQSFYSSVTLMTYFLCGPMEKKKLVRFLDELNNF